jgi:hypothetical protein
MMDGVGLDIVEANPSAFGTVLAHAKPKTTADAMNVLAGEVYAEKSGNPKVDGEDEGVGGIFSGKGALIDSAAIYAAYNKPKGKRGGDT